MRKTLSLAAVAALTSAVFAHGDGSHAAQDDRYTESKYRHQLMEVVGYSAKNIVMHMKGEVDLDGQMLGHARILDQAAAMAKDAFAKDTRHKQGKTDSKDAVWENWEDFSSRLDSFKSDTAALVSALESEEGVPAATKAMFKNCKSCHDEYRKD
ncbi:c-type cytochrome [Yunchengibacter salinarum]|uniref:c-type cytochrome n=1 Tax=Yunchengibacter salinarum TaxID=3133399 RepID=UPI0035B5A10C